MEVPDVSYAQSGDVSITDQAVGDGPQDLVAGSGYGIEFEDRGERELTCVTGEWRLYAV